MRAGSRGCQARHSPLSFSVSQVSDILRYLFPVPKDDSHRVITFANQDDYISFRYVYGLGSVYLYRLLLPAAAPYLLSLLPCLPLSQAPCVQEDQPPQC